MVLGSTAAFLALVADRISGAFIMPDASQAVGWYTPKAIDCVWHASTKRSSSCISD